MKTNHCFVGDNRESMRRMIVDGYAGQVQTIITSPPYWGLRDYGVDGQLGLEPTLAEFLANMVDVFDLCRQLLTDDGTLWLNMGDCYMTGAGKVSTAPGGGTQGGKWKEVRGEGSMFARGPLQQPNRMPQNGFKPKDLAGQPWRLAFALQDAGWYLRQDIIWHKPNPMPESVADRCTKSHEYIFLLTKNERYFFDQEAIREKASPNTNARRSKAALALIGEGVGHRQGPPGNDAPRTPAGWATGTDRKHDEIGGRYTEKRKVYAGNGVGFGRGTDAEQRARGRVKNNASFDEAMAIMPDTRNKRSVWTIPTQSYSEAHFATFPEALVEPCVLAGSRAGQIVFDPFMGSGTTAKVAQRLGRHWLGCELNPHYVDLQADRTRQQGLMLEHTA